METGLSPETKVFAGGADNACGAIGTGVLSEGKTLCSIGTSGVVLSYETDGSQDYQGKVHYFNHAKTDGFYLMGVTLSAGYSFDWFRNTFAPDQSFAEIVQEAAGSSIGAGGLLFSPYLVGERTPYADSTIRGSFIGIDSTHTKGDFARAVMEGVTFSLNESIEILRANGKTINSIVSIGGGAKTEEWLQLQANIFNASVVKLENEQGPGMGAAIIAAYGCGWFDSMEACAETFIKIDKVIEPQENIVEQYRELFEIYQEIYKSSKSISAKLEKFRK
jgi:xylulokinase